MKNLFKYLKPYAASIVAILAVLVLQSYCDLSLPAYTSDVVNVGIQQGGIDTAIPEQISVEDMDKLLLFVPEKSQDTVKDAYEKDTKTFDKEAYVLKDGILEDEEKTDQLSEILGKPMMIVASMSADDEDTQKMMNSMMSEMQSQNASAAQQMQEQAGADPDSQAQMQAAQAAQAQAGAGKDMDIFDMFSMMPAEQREETIKTIEDKISGMPETMIEQAATLYIKAAYEDLGVDMDHVQTQYILTTGAKMLGLAFLGMAASVLVGLIASRVAASNGRNLRGKVFKKVVGFSNSEFDKFSTASLITRSTNDIQQIQMLTVMLLRMVLYAPIIGVGAVFKVFHTNADMSWILALAVIMIVMVVVVLFTMVMPKFKIVQKQVDKLNLVTREILTGLPVIRAFSNEKHEEKRFDGANRDLTKTNLFVNRAMTFMMPMMMFIMNGITVLIVWTGAHGIDSGQMQVGDMMAFIQYTMQIIMAFLMICMISVMLPRAAVSADRVNEVLVSETIIDDPENPSEYPANGKGLLTFDHVSFRYPGAEEDVLHDITFTAEPGKTTAIIGSTGSGKSTLVNLIPRFYDATEGEILIDGVNVKDVTQHQLRERLGFVPQKGVLFSGTIESNITYGKPDATEEEMKEAARIAQAEDFIEEKNEKYDSHIAQGGSNVSGGQKQRLSIARAIAKNPDIFIFDDSFSALDYKTDTVLRRALKDHTADSTVLIVAQRISTILHAEQIIVLDDGKIAGKGTHRELLKNCEVYYQIASSQLSEKELEEDLQTADNTGEVKNHE